MLCLILSGSWVIIYFVPYEIDKEYAWGYIIPSIQILSTGLRVPVPLFLMKNSLSAFLFTRSTASVTLDRLCVRVCVCVLIMSGGCGEMEHMQ